MTQMKSSYMTQSRSYFGNLFWILIVILRLLLFPLFCPDDMDVAFSLLSDDASSSPAEIDITATASELDSMDPIARDEMLNSFLNGPDAYGNVDETDCPPECGCPEYRSNCPTWFSIKAVEQSAAVQDPSVLQYHDNLNKQSHQKARIACQVEIEVKQKPGMLCLYVNGATDYQFVHAKAAIAYRLPIYLVPASPLIVQELTKLFQEDGTQSVLELGGVAQYKQALSNTLPHLKLDAYTGAGNGEEYTQGMAKYADLTLPLNLPVADWVLSFEAAEHISSQKEGFYFRNLHRHNRKGIILSWAVTWQKGYGHINCHSNTYVIEILTALGYDYDQDLTNKMREESMNYKGFLRSIMVFRRRKPPSSSSLLIT